MKAYLAAAYERRDEMKGVAHVLQTFGHTITSTWVTSHADGPPMSFEQTLVEYRDNTERCGAFGDRDLTDIESADTLIAFTDGEKARGGRHVEFGYALALEKNLYVVGPREVIFHTLPGVAWYPNWARFVMALPDRTGNGIYPVLRPGA